METAEYIEEEITIAGKSANTKAFYLMLPLIIMTLTPFYLIWIDQLTMEAVRSFIESTKSWHGYGTALIILVFIAGIIAHEFIHGVTWALYAKRGIRSINFGIVWKELTPYSHCKEVMKVRYYRIGIVMPAIILGFLPTLVSYLTGNFWFAIFGALFTAAAAGDFMILNMIKNERDNDLVRDHPEKIGYYIYRRRSENG
jgi:hypothetical protein